MRTVCHVALLGLVLFAGCASPRLSAPASGQPAVPIQMPASIRYLSADTDESVQRALEFWQHLGRHAERHPVNLLALSGGGADGAFAAGALVGLGKRDARPGYDVVTGVSTGALLAPFAFLGSAWDRQLQVLFSSETGRSLLRLNWPGKSGLYSSAPLRQLIERTYDDRLIEAIAAAGASGRVLLIGTTNLDDESPVIWDMTALAALASAPARTLFRQVLLASASYPALLAPVMIEVETPEGRRHEMHVDGGATLPLFLGPGVDALDAEAIGALPGVHAYVLINRQLNATGRTVSPALVPVLRRALSTESRLTTRMALGAAERFAARHGLELSVADIPQRADIPRPFDFANPGVRALFDSAEGRAARGTLWQSAAQALNSQPPVNLNAAF